MATDYSEIFMQSVDLLVHKRMSELQFDKTISCQIVDNSAADRGEYSVSDGSTTFIAYSKDVTFKQGDNVYVTIPNGDFNNQKQIIGKYVNPGDNLNYVSPLEAYVDITGDLCNFTAGAGLLANRPDIVNEDSPVEFYSKKVIWKANIQNGKAFERLCLRADFKTWLKNLNTNSGNYGLCLYVKYLKEDSNVEDVAQYIMDSDSMCGNPYNFNTYFTQEKVFDISDIKGQIVYMELVFYQDFNFKDVSGLNIPHYIEKNGKREYLIENIYVNNIHIGLGYDINKFKEDTILLYCNNKTTYNYNSLTQDNRKKLEIRWVRVTNEGIYSVDTEREIPENAAIHWYKYEVKFQEEVDELAGPLWFEIEEGLNKLSLEVDPDTNELSQLYKVVIENPSKQWIEQKLDASYNADIRLLEAKADDANAADDERRVAQEKLASYKSEIQSTRKVYESEVLEFKSAVPVVDRMTADLINGLKIEVDEKGYKGNYMLYNASNKITNINEATKMRVMRATYKSLVTGEQTLDGAESIIWKIPLTSTMIYPPENGKEYDTSKSDTSYWVEGGYAYIKRMSGNSNSGSMGTVNDWSCEQKFRIKDYYQESATNNIVYCYVVKNNIAYEASVELYFGPMSSNGTDFTFKMGFESDTAAVTRETPEVLRINFQMFDFNNDKVPNFWENGITVNWYAKSDIDEIYFCNQDGKIVSNSEFTFLDATGKTISDDKTIPTKVIVKANHFYIKYKGTAGVVPNYYVAQAVVTTDPTIGAGAAQANQIRLSCQLLIPYRDNKKYAGIEGATHILYSSSGTQPEMYDGRYRLWVNKENERVEETDITWRVYPNFSLITAHYYPKLGEGNKLLVPSTYVENLSTQICIQAIGQNEKVLWSHPIVMMKDAYSSAMLNAWDGNLTIDNENGTILSTMIGAGKKESDNSYSGVLMGDVKCALDDVTKIGLYGFNFGLQSFGWMVDGKGFIGKEGQGQILFDGNKGTISSGAWRTTQGKIGMEIDLDGPTTTNPNEVSTGSTFKMKGLAGTISFDTSAKDTGTKLFVVQGRLPDNDNFTNPVYNKTIQVNNETKSVSVNGSNSLKYKDLIKIAIDTRESDGATGTHAIAQESSFYIQSLNFNTTENAATGIKKSGTRLDLHNGKFISYGTCGRVEIATSSNTFFRLADGGNNILFMIKSVDDDEDGSGTASQYYLQSSTFNASAGIGTRLDLQHGKYTSYGSQGRIVINSSANAMFTIDHRSGNNYSNLMTVGGEGYWLQSKDYTNTSGVRFDLGDGKITAYNFKIYATGGNGSITIDSGAITNPLDINGNFTVDWQGNATIKGSAKIGGNATIDGTLTIGEGGSIKSGGGSYYEFNQNGATIGGWTITKTSISNGDTKLSVGTSGTDGLIETSNLKCTGGDINLTSPAGGYFRMGSVNSAQMTYIHPVVSGLNVEAGGIKMDGKHGISECESIGGSNGSIWFNGNGNTGKIYVDGNLLINSGNMYIHRGSGYNDDVLLSKYIQGVVYTSVEDTIMVDYSGDLTNYYKITIKNGLITGIEFTGDGRAQVQLRDPTGNM